MVDNLCFVTGNQAKIADYLAVIPGLKITGDVDFVEPQKLNQEDIVRDKLLTARKADSESRLICEDVGLFLTVEGMVLDTPGILTKQWLKKYKSYGTAQKLLLMCNRYPLSAAFLCTLGLLEPGSNKPVFFQGRTDGIIITPPQDRIPPKFKGIEILFAVPTTTGSHTVMADLSAEGRKLVHPRFKAADLLLQHFSQEVLTTTV